MLPLLKIEVYRKGLERRVTHDVEMIEADRFLYRH